MIDIQKFRGTGVALVTPFKNNEIDYDALTAIIEHQISGGVDFLVSLGTTGESVTLTFDECVSVLKHTIKVNNKRLPIVAGMFGSNNTAALRQKIIDFDFDGIDAILSSSPAYVKPTQEGIFAHYAAIEEVCPVPIILYNVPGRTASNINAQTLIKLARHSKKFIAVKDASGDMDQALYLIENKPDHFLALSGDDPSAFHFIASGGDGIISVIGNAYPAEWSALVNNIFKGNIETAKTINNRLNPIHKWLYIEGNPTGIKGSMEHLGFCEREVRLPLLPMTNRNLTHLKTAMDLAKTTLKVG
jgi:4-hydroxy-tetrahydrodipicolinate synthase